MSKIFPTIFVNIFPNIFVNIVSEYLPLTNFKGNKVIEDIDATISWRQCTVH